MRGSFIRSDRHELLIVVRAADWADLKLRAKEGSRVMGKPQFGFIDWKPRDTTRELIKMVRAILKEFENELPLTLRQIYYRAVAKYGFDKTDEAYARLGEHCATARRAGWIPFSAIRDDGAVSAEPFEHADPAGFWRMVRGLAGRYRRARQAGQTYKLIVMPEAAGMVPQLEKVADPFGVSVKSGGGYGSVTQKQDLAREIADSDRPVTVLHLGDFDPSGSDMFNNLWLDISIFVAQMRAGIDPADRSPFEARNGSSIAKLTEDAIADEEEDDPWVAFVRLAITPEQNPEVRLADRASEANQRTHQGLGSQARRHGHRSTRSAAAG